MSIPIHEKIEMIRAGKGMTQQELSEALGISINTLKGMLRRGSSPKFEVIEKIGQLWPEYAYWLLTEKTSPPMHCAPAGFMPETNYKIIDVVFADGMHRGLVRPETMGRLKFLQDPTDRNLLAAVIEIKDGYHYKFVGEVNEKLCVWIEPEQMNFNSDGGGKTTLSLFRRWLKENNSDLIKTAVMVPFNLKNFDAKIGTSFQAEKKVLTAENNEEFSSDMNLQRFLMWVEGCEAYGK